MIWSEMRQLRDELDSFQVEVPEQWQRVEEWKARVHSVLEQGSPEDAKRFAALEIKPEWYHRMIVSPSDAGVEARVDLEERDFNAKAASKAKREIAAFLEEIIHFGERPAATAISPLPLGASPRAIREAILDALYGAHHHEPRVGMTWRSLVESLGINETQFEAAMSYLNEQGLAEYRSNVACRITATGIDRVEERRAKGAVIPAASMSEDHKPPGANNDDLDEMDAGELEIIGHIDSGLFGRVYRARQVALDRIVAVKVIKSEFAHLADAVAYAKALARVGVHPNIVTVYGVQPVKLEGVPHPAMVMEWLEGETFAMRLAGPRFSEQEVRRICSGVLDAVDRMHASGMQHGDLHMGNVILLADCHPKIIDIDASKNRSLGRLSEVSREGAIAADVDYCRKLVEMAFAHSILGPSLANALDRELEAADSLAEIRGCIERALAAPSTHGRVAAPVSRAETVESLSAKVREYIEGNRPASLHDVMMRQVVRIKDELVSERFTLKAAEVTPAVVRERIARYVDCVSTMLPALAFGCYWGDRSHWNLWKQCIETVANCYEDLDENARSGRRVLADLRQYPVLLMVYSAGLGAFLNERFDTLQFLVSGLEYVDLRRRSLLMNELVYWAAEQGKVWDQLVVNDGRSHVSPISDHVSDVMYGVLGGIVPVRSGFATQFDRFEYMLGLMRCSESSVDATPENIHVPTATYVWRRADEQEFSEYLTTQAAAQGTEWPPFRVGLFGGRHQALAQLIGRFDAAVRLLRDNLGIRVLRQ